MKKVQSCKVVLTEGVAGGNIWVKSEQMFAEEGLKGGL